MDGHGPDASRRPDAYAPVTSGPYRDLMSSAADPAVAAMASLLKAKLTSKAPHVHTYTVIKRR